MAQRDCPVQADETDVTRALRRFADLMGWCVTSTTGGAHSRTSYHYLGQAVDLACREGPGWDSEQLLAINETIIRVLPLSMILELIYSGPGNVCVKRGRIVDGRKAYGPTIMDRHHDHVHLAVVPTFTYNGGSQRMAADDPNRANVNAPIVGGMAAYRENGDIKGFILIGADGGTFHFGEGVPQFGNVEYVKPDGRDWLPKI